MEGIIKIAAIGIIGVLLSETVKECKKEFSVIIGLGTGIAIIWALFEDILRIKNLLSTMVTEAGINNMYVGVMVKAVIIAYISEFAVQLCNDAGEKAIASKIEIGSKVIIIAMSIPIISSLLELIIEILP